VLFSIIIIVLENNRKPTQLGRFLLLPVIKLGIQNRLNINCKFFQTGSYAGYKLLFSKMTMVLENNKKPIQMGRFLFFIKK